MRGAKLLCVFVLLIVITVESPVENNKNSISNRRDKRQEYKLSIKINGQTINGQVNENVDENTETSEEEDDNLEEEPDNKDSYLRTTDDLEDFYDMEFDTKALIKPTLKDDGELNDDLDGGGTGVTDKALQWTKKGKFVTIPYFINKLSGYSEEQIHNITTAMGRIEARTCVRFVERVGNEMQHIEVLSIAGKLN